MSKMAKMAHVFEKKWRSQDVRLREEVDFSALLLEDRILKGLKKAGFKKPSPIQFEAIPMGRFGKDMLVQAKAGTGKTLVFAVIALEMLHYKLFRPQVLVIVPTREIATQVCSVIKAIGVGFHKLTCNCFIGGLPLFEDQEKAATTQIAVGTPGRLNQLIKLKSLPANSIRLLVFDEADELLHSNSFKDEIEDIFTSLPDDKQVIATSATYNPKVKKMLYRYLCDPFVVRLNAKHLALLGMVHYVHFVEFCPMPVILYRNKLTALENILKTVKFAQCLLFCNGIQKVEILYRDVKRLGFSTAYISSAKEQCDRLKAMERLKRFKCKVLVSSDLTSRGIDAENVDLVINFDLSYTSEIYMHRVGRAGRFGSIGAAISIIDDKEIKYMHRIEKEGAFKAFKLPDPIPTDLILYPPEGEFAIAEPELENDSEAKTSNIITCDVLHDQDYYKTLDLVNGINFAKFDVWTDNKYDSEKEANAKHTEVETVSETTAGDADENILSGLVADDMKSHDSIKHALECEMKDEEREKGGIDYLEDKNIKTANHSKHSDDNKLQNEHTSDDGIELDESKDTDLLKDFDQNDLIGTKSGDTHYVCDTYEKAHNFCDKNVLEQQDVTKDIKNDVYDVTKENNIEADDKKLNEAGNIKIGVYDVNDVTKENNIEADDKKLNEAGNIKIGVYDVIEKNNFEADAKKLNEADFDNVPQSSEQKDIEKMSEDGSVKNLHKSSEPEAIVKDDVKGAEENLSCHNLNDMIKIFLDAHVIESSKRQKSIKSKIVTDGCNQQMEESDKNLITTDMIHSLQFQRHEFYYETFKKFQEKEECSVASNIEKEDKEKSNEHTANLDLANEESNITHEKLAEKSESENKDISPEKFAIKNTPLDSEGIITIPAHLADTSEFGIKKNFPEKPTFESTPHAADKIQQEIAKIPTNDACSPKFPSKISRLFDELSDETESDYSASSDETSEVQNQSSAANSKSQSQLSDSESVSSSSDSSSVSPSSDSEDDSDSETDSLTESESTSNSSFSTAASSEESAYRHNYSRTGRQNPSLVSGSVRGDQNDEYLKDHKCFCCCGAVKERMPQQRRKHCSRIPSHNRSTCYRNVENIPHHSNSSFDHRENFYSGGVYSSRCRRLTQSCSPRGHSKCHRFRNPPSCVTRERGNQNIVGYPTHPRSFGHHHTPDCFMPTAHRCHPNTPDYPCEQGQLCEMWYKTFYNQWLHIQRASH